MRNHIMPIFAEILKFLFYALCTALALLIVILITSIDIQTIGSIPEDSLTELTQESLLAISVLLFLYKIIKEKATGLFLVLGLLLCMLIREFDAFFDQIFHGAWKFLAAPAAILCIYLALKDGLSATSQHMKSFFNSTSYKFFFAGMIIILVMSRILGMRIMGEFIFDAHFHQSIKSFLEEGSELFGYIFLFMGSVGYCLMPDYTQKIKS